MLITQDGQYDVTETNTSVDEVFDFGENLTSSAAIGTITVDATSSYYIYGDSSFSIDSTTGILSYDGEGFNYEVDDTVVPLIIYVVSNDVLTDVMRVEVNIIDAEDLMNLPDSYEFTLYEKTSNFELGIITATDEDVEDGFTYEFLNGTHIYNDFRINTNTGALTYVGVVLDYETDDEIVDEFQVLARSSDGEVRITDVTVSLDNIYEGVITTQSFDAVWTVRAGVEEVYDVNVSEYFTNLDGGALTYTVSLDGINLSEFDDWLKINTTTGELSVTDAVVQNNDNQIITITATNKYGVSTTQDIKLSVGATDVPTPSGDLFANVNEDVSTTRVLYDIETDDTSLIGPNSAIEYFILDDPSGLFEIADYDRGEVTLKDGMFLDYDTQSSHVIRIETKHYNDAAIPHNSIPAHSSIRLFWDLTINVNDPDPERIIEPASINDTSRPSIFIGTDDGDVNTKHAQYTFNVDENQTNIDIGQISSSSNVEYFFYNGAKSYNSFSLVKETSNVTTLHYDDLTDYEKQSRYELELWGQVQDDAGVATGWSKISVTINVINDSTEAPEFYTDVYVFKLPHNHSDTNNDIYVGSVTAKDNGGSVSYSFTNPNAVSNFTLNSTTGEISYIGTGTSEGDIYFLSVAATDTNGEITQTDVLVTQDGLHDVNETNTSVDETFGFSENLTSSAAIGTITVDGTSSYYIYGNNGFSIDSTTGILSYDGEGFNYETDAVVPLTIYVVSNDVLTDVMRVEVNIIDVEDPMNLPDSYAFTLSENTSDVELGIITATDEDIEDTITYEFLNGTNIYNDFTLNTNTGALTYVGRKLDYETNGNLVDEFQIRARSSGDEVKITDVTVSLGNIYEGVITTQSFDAVWVVRAGIAEVYDVYVSEYFTNLDDRELTYTVSLDGEDFSGYDWLNIDDTTGELSVTDSAVQNNDNQIITITATNKYGLSATQDIKLSVGHVNVPTPSGDLFVSVNEDVSATEVLYDIETDDTSLIGPNSFIEYYINNDPSGLFEIADYLTGEVTLKAGMSLDYDTQSSHVIRIETEHYNNAVLPHKSIPGWQSVRLYWDLTINVNDPSPPPEIIVEPEDINDTSNTSVYFVGTDDGDVNTGYAQYTFNVDENQTNIDIGDIGTSEITEYFFYNGTKSYGDFSLVQVLLGVATLHYDGLTDYETQSQYELELWGQIQDDDGVATGWSKISVTINVNDDSTEAPEFYADEYVFKLPENISDTNNGIYVGTVTTKGNEDSISYSFTDPNAVSNFTLNSVTGEIFYIGTGTSEGDIQYLSIIATTLNGETTATEVFITQDGLHDITETNTNVDNEVLNFGENLTSAAIGTITVDGTSSYYIYGDSSFSIDSTAGILSYDGEGFNYETDAVVSLTIYAISNDVLTDVMRVEVNIIDIEESVNLTDSYEFTLYENTSDVELGIITATDEDVEDTEDTITYEFLNGTHIYNDFIIDTNTGALTYVGVVLDYEASDKIVDEFQVLARSSDGEVKITDVTVSLGNIYEGVITTQSFDAVWTVRAGVAEVYDVNVSEYFTNLDDGALTYTASLDGEDFSGYAGFNFNATTGVLSATDSVLQNNDRRNITITATNEYGLSTTQDIRLFVGHAIRDVSSVSISYKTLSCIYTFIYIGEEVTRRCGYIHMSNR